MEDRTESRRDVVKKLAYVAPIVLSLAASPAVATAGSRLAPRPDMNPDGRQTRRLGQ